jgi:hypothetical protein
MIEFFSVVLGATNALESMIDPRNYHRFEAKFEDTRLSDLAIISNSGSAGTLVVLPKELEVSMKNRFRAQNCSKVFLENHTKGALCTLGMILELIPENFPVVVSSIHGYIRKGLTSFVESMKEANAEAGVITFKASDEKYSYLRIVDGKVLEISEKIIIGDDATAGIFYFKNKENIIKALEWSLLNNVQTQGLYFVAPSLNYFVTNALKIVPWSTLESDYIRFSTIEESEQAKEKLRHP